MRIVVTKNGKILFKELEDESPSNAKFKIKSLQTSSYSKLPIIFSNEDLLKKFNNKANNNKFIMTILRNKKISNKRRSNSIIPQKSEDNFFSEGNSKRETSELMKAKKIKINRSRTNISQFFLEKYDSFDENFKKKLLDFKIFSNEKKTDEGYNNMDFKIGNNNRINSMNIMNNNTNDNSSKFSSKKSNRINIGDIISKANVLTLRNQISKYNTGSNDVRFPLDENNIKSYNFRSKYENKQATDDDMDLILNYGINTDKPSIIKYFKQNKKISPYYIENLLKYDEKKMNKLNKILDIILSNKNENKKGKISFLSKINDDKDRNEDLNLKTIENVIKRSSSIINGHSSLNEKMKFWKLKAYQEDTDNIKKKYWVKYDVDRFLKNKQRKGSMTISLKNEKIKKLYSSPSTPNFLTNF